MSHPRYLMDTKHMEAITVLRRALDLLDSLDLTIEAALVSQALETLLASVAPVSHAGAE